MPINPIYTTATASISDLKKDPMGVLSVQALATQAQWQYSTATNLFFTASAQSCLPICKMP